MRTTEALLVRHFGYRGIQIRVECPYETHLQWLDEFLQPWFTSEDDGPWSWRVVFSDDRGAYETLRRRGPRRDGALLDCFALDAAVLRLPAWTSDEGTTTVFEERASVFFSVDSRVRTVRVVAGTPYAWQRIGLMRVVRELAMNHALRSDALFLHASASVLGRDGIVVTGPRSAGKTTLLVYLLSRGARFVANDRVLVSVDDAGVRLHGMPTLVAVRPGTFDFFPPFRDRLLASAYATAWTLAEARALPPPDARTVGDEKTDVTPAQFLDLLGARATPACEAGVVLFPRVTPAVGDFALERLDPADAAHRFRPSLLGVPPWRKTADVFSSPTDPEPLAPARLSALCRELAERVPCFECRLGPEAYRDARLATAVADAAPSGTRHSAGRRDG